MIGRRRSQAELRSIRRLERRSVDGQAIAHLLKDALAHACDAFRIAPRIDPATGHAEPSAANRADEGGEHRGLRQRQLGQRPSELAPGRAFSAAPSQAEVRAVGRRVHVLPGQVG